MADYTARSSVILNGQQAEDQLEKLGKRAKDLRDEMKKLREANDLAGFKEKERELKEVNKEMGQMRKEVFSVEAVLKNLSGASFKEISTAARKANNEFKVMKQTDPGYAAKATQVKLLNGKMRELSTLTRSQQSLWSRAADGFNKFFGMATAAVASFAGVVMGMKRMKTTLDEFEETMTNVYTLLDEADFNKFKNQLDEGSVELLRQYGFEIKDINKALFDTISAGVPAAQSMNFMKEASILAKGGVTSLSISVDGMTSIVNAYGLKMSEVNEVSAAFFTAQKYGKTTVEELASTVGAAVPIAAQAGVSYRELLSSVAALTTQGISTDMAMTSVKNALQSLLKPGTEAEKILRQFGVPVGATEVRLKGLGFTLERLNEVMLKNPDAISKAIPNIRGLTAVSALSGRGLEKYHEILQKVNQDFGEGSSLMGAYNKQMDTDVAKQQARMGELKATILELGDTLRPVFVDVIRLSSWSFRTLLNVVKALAENKGAIISLIAGIAAYTLVVKAHVIWQRIYNTAVQIGTLATKGFNTAVKSNPIGIIIGLLTLAATAFYSYSNKVGSAKKSQKEFNDEVERGNELLGQSKTLEERASIVKNLSNTQLENLKSDLQNQIAAEDDFHATLLQKLKKRLDEDETLKKLREQRSQDGLTQIQKINLDAQIAARKRGLSMELEDENKTNQQRLNNLKTHLANVDKELKLRPNENVGGIPSGDFEAIKKALETSFVQEQNLLKQQLLEKKITKEDFNREQYTLELAHLVAMRELYKQHGEDFITIEGQIIDKKIAWQQHLEQMLETSTSVTEKLLDDDRKMFADIDADMDKYMDDYQKKLDKQTEATIEAEDKKREAREKAKEAQITQAVEAGAAAVENAETVAEAGKAILNSIRQQIRGYIAEAVTTAALKALKSVPFPFNIAAATVAGGAASFLFNKLIPKFAAGKYPDAEYAGRPRTGMYGDKPQYALFNEVPGQPEMVIDGLTTRKININYPEIRDAIYAVRDGRAPQFADGKYPSSSTVPLAKGDERSGGGNSSNPEQNKILSELAAELRELRKWRPAMDIHTFKKKENEYNDIQNKRGLKYE